MPPPPTKPLVSLGAPQALEKSKAHLSCSSIETCAQTQCFIIFLSLCYYMQPPLMQRKADSYGLLVHTSRCIFIFLFATTITLCNISSAYMRQASVTATIRLQLANMIQESGDATVSVAAWGVVGCPGEQEVRERNEVTRPTQKISSLTAKDAQLQRGGTFWTNDGQEANDHLEGCYGGGALDVCTPPAKSLVSLGAPQALDKSKAHLSCLS